MLLKTFGCACFSLLRPYNQHKVSFRTSKCVFIGYSFVHKGYKCLHPSGRVYIARSVTFNEAEYPYHSLFNKSSSSSPVTHVMHSGFLFPAVSSTPPDLPSSPSTQSLRSSSQSPSSAVPSFHTSSTTQPHHTCESSLPFIPVSELRIDLPVPPINHNAHSMVTRSKTRNLKPKTFLANINSELEPLNVKQALADPCWKQAMCFEFQALQANNTWSLVPFTSDMPVISLVGFFASSITMMEP